MPEVAAVSVVPVVVISARGLLCLAFYNRLAAVVSRLRAFHRERLHEHADWAASLRAKQAWQRARAVPDQSPDANGGPAGN